MSKFATLAILVFILFAAFILATASVRSQDIDRMTPLMLDVQDAPIPFNGSDGRTHLVYELGLKNFTSGKLIVEKVEVLADNATVLATLDAGEIATRLQLAGTHESTGTMLPSTAALLFIHVTMPAAEAEPHVLMHRVQVRAEAAPPGQQEITETGGAITVNARPVVVLAPPLHGDGYISADSCCDATRHTRAALPVNGRVWLGQRYAVDWEQLDASGRIYHGPRGDVHNYTIYGKEVFAGADARVAVVMDGAPNETPGKYPTNISVQKADGNAVILDFGNGNFGLYAHLAPQSIRVHRGDTVKRNQVIGLVGNTGNSVAPHLHFHVMSTTSPLASNGLPYELDHYQITATSPGTKAFDAAEEHGTPLTITPISPPSPVTSALPLDQLIISFAP